MTKFQVILGIVLTIGALAVWSAEIPKPSYTRTMLKVARSLPGETEELKVRTSEGNVATLIVKRREKNEKISGEKVSDGSKDNPGVSKTEEIAISGSNVSQDRRDEVRRSESAQIEQIRMKTSQNLDSRSGELEKSSENRSSSENNEEKEKSNSFAGTRIDYGRWTPLSQDGRAFETGESTSDNLFEWKPLPVDKNIVVDDRTNFARYKSPEIRRDGSTRNLDNDGVIRGRIIGNQPTQYAFLAHQPRPLTRTNIGANLSKNRGGKNVPAEVTVRSEINVKSLPKRTPMSMDADGTPVIHGIRVPDEPIDTIQTWRNARVINNKLVSEAGIAPLNSELSSGSSSGSDNADRRQRFEQYFNDVNRRYGRNFDDERNVYFEWDPKSHQEGSLSAEVYDSRTENYRPSSQKRMLRPESTQIYPTSQMYTPVSQKIAPLALKPGARTPVLQYAHPELGVQPAKILKSEKRRPDNFPDNQNSFTEQRHKKKYVLNDKNVVDSYTVKNYYPNQHFYGLKYQPNDQPFWVKISENLKNQFSTGVERVSQLTRPVFDPLVEATHKISQNLGLTAKGKDEAQDKIGTVATGSSILIPALGLVASGAALGIGAVAVGRYLDVDVLKRSQNLDYYNRRDENENDDDDDEEEALRAIYEESYDDSATEDHSRMRAARSASGYDGPSGINEDDVLVVMEEMNDQRKIDDTDFLRTRRSKRSVDNFGDDKKNENFLRNLRLRRTGPDSLEEIIEIDVPTKSIGKRQDDDQFYSVKEDNNVADNTVDPDEAPNDDDQLQVETILRETSRLPDRSSNRRRRSVYDDQELDDAYQNLENSEVAEVAHIAGDWTNTPCAKRIFCDAMIQKGHDASIFMEKKMDGLLRLIQPGAAMQVSNHFQEVMEAVRRHDCSSFLCPQARPGNVFF